MRATCRFLSIVLWVAITSTAVAASAQPRWVEVKGPTVTVASDAGAGRARDIAWQFEQVREALQQTFPWIRWHLSRPLLVFAARGESTMRTLVPGTFEQRDGRLFSAISAGGRDRSYVAMRADLRGDDREGINPNQTAYWAYTSQALGETFGGLPPWLWRGLAEVTSNTIVRDSEIQIGRILPVNLATLRSQGRLGLRELVGITDADPRLRRPEFLHDFDSNAWAFVHFMLFGDEGAHQAAFNAYISGLLKGGEPDALLTSTIGDVARFEGPFNVYVNRNLFGYVKFAISAKLSREGFRSRDLSVEESSVLRAGLHVAMGRPKEAHALVDEAQKANPGFGVDEVLALQADRDNRDDDVRASLEKAVTLPHASWYAHYRLATLLPTDDDTALTRIEVLLSRATTLNPFADRAWGFLGEVMAALGRQESALGAVDKAIGLVPASTAHHLSRSRVLRRLGRRDDALSAAGISRALARSPEERAAAQGMLAELAKDALARPASSPTAAIEPRATASAAAVETAPSTSDASGAGPAGVPVDRAALAGVTTRAGSREIGYLIDACFSSPATCRSALPDIAGDCNGGGTPTSAAACRSAGYILDAAIGVPAAPMMAADFYRKGCARRDEISCVRLATLQALGRGVPRDAAAAVAVLDASCKNDVQEACFRLGVHLTSTKVPADLARGREILTASCKAEFAESCAWLKKLPRG